MLDEIGDSLSLPGDLKFSSFSSKKLIPKVEKLNPEKEYLTIKTKLPIQMASL
jgi:hypothetical protein